MFKIENKEFHVTRGDAGAFEFYIPIKDEDGYWKYQDSESNVYWYDPKEKKLYDELYKTTDVDKKTLTLQLHKFKPEDIVRFKVFKAKDCGCVEIQKDFKVTEETTKVKITLEKGETKIGDVINKPTKYWYEIELNPDTKPQTVIGYDQDGEKLFILYPEGSDKQ